MSLIRASVLIPIHHEAERFFQANRGGSWVSRYLQERGFDEPTQRAWQLGYAPDQWRSLTNHLRRLGFSDTAIEDSGLARGTSRGMLIDFFRNRAMFPIKNLDATTIAFVGRAPDHAPDSTPRYLNSPHTAIYRKWQALFGLHKLTADATPVITEGPLDAIAVTSASDGRFTGLALCGTALHADHVRTLTRSTDLRHVLLAFDGDRAGREAAVHAYPHFKSVCTANAAVLPAGHDPAQTLSDDGPATLMTILTDRHRPLADLVLDAAIEPWQRSLEFAEGRIGALRSAGSAIAAMAAHDVARQIARVAARLGFDHPTITEAVTDSLSSRLSDGDFPRRALRGTATTRTQGRKPDERPLRGPTP